MSGNNDLGLEKFDPFQRFEPDLPILLCPCVQIWKVFTDQAVSRVQDAIVRNPYRNIRWRVPGSQEDLNVQVTQIEGFVVVYETIRV